MAQVTLPFPQPANSGQYADDLDAELGAPLPVNPAAAAVTSAWVQSESASFPGFNGLGTELALPGSTPDPSNPNVFDYPTLQEGLAAAVDEITGSGPQTHALAPQFATDVKSGTATASQLVTDIYNSDWDGSPDKYDSSAIMAKLKNSNFAVTGSPASASGAAGSSSAPAQASTASIDWNPLSWPGKIVGSAASSIAGDVGTYILKGVLTLMGAGMFVYGSTLLTSRGGGAASGAAAGGAAESPLDDVAEDLPFAAAA